MCTINVIKGIIFFLFSLNIHIVKRFEATDLYMLWRECIKFSAENKTADKWYRESPYVVRTITVAICCLFLLQWAAIILWYIIAGNYFKLNKIYADEMEKE